jgi:HAD superfamily hydrolase (TIGR01459 family)
MNSELIKDIPVLQNAQEIGRNYDAWMVDLWGVMHDGMNAIDSAVEACERFRNEGGIVVLISNAPRPYPYVREQIEGYGVPASVDDGIVTSGDVAQALISMNLDKRFFFIGPERDRSLFDGFDVELVDLEDAELVMMSGIIDDSNETPEDYRAVLEDLSERELPMICANPDIKVERGDEVIYAAGAVAQLYEQMGGQVVYTGKPFQPIYDMGHARINELSGRTVPRERILAIGDGVDTDIKGAVMAGIDPLFIPSPVYLKDHNREGGLAASAVSKLFQDRDFRPIACLPRLQW